jgi:hypothetical protein
MARPHGIALPGGSADGTGVRPAARAAAAVVAAGVASTVYQRAADAADRHFVHVMWRDVYVCAMSETDRLIVTLDAEHAARLTALAERAHVERSTLARSLLSAAIDESDPDSATITDILDRIPGTWERAQRGHTGDSIPLSEL